MHEFSSQFSVKICTTIWNVFLSFEKYRDLKTEFRFGVLELCIFCDKNIQRLRFGKSKITSYGTYVVNMVGDGAE